MLLKYTVKICFEWHSRTTFFKCTLYSGVIGYIAYEVTGLLDNKLILENCKIAPSFGQNHNYRTRKMVPLNKWDQLIRSISIMDCEYHAVVESVRVQKRRSIKKRISCKFSFNQHLKTNWTNERLALTNLTWFKVNSLKKSQISSTEREKKEMTVTTRKQVSESRK